MSAMSLFVMALVSAALLGLALEIESYVLGIPAVVAMLAGLVASGVRGWIELEDM